MINGSHLLEPPPRSELVQIEWKCTKCGLFGTASLALEEPAARIFSKMARNHKIQSTPNDPTRPGKKLKVDPACMYPVFNWARIL